MKCKLCQREMSKATLYHDGLHISAWNCTCKGQRLQYQWSEWIEMRWWDCVIDNKEAYSYRVDNLLHKNEYQVSVWHQGECWLRYSKPGQIDLTSTKALEDEVFIAGQPGSVAITMF